MGAGQRSRPRRTGRPLRATPLPWKRRPSGVGVECSPGAAAGAWRRSGRLGAKQKGGRQGAADDGGLCMLASDFVLPCLAAPPSPSLPYFCEHAHRLSSRSQQLRDQCLLHYSCSCPTALLVHAHRLSSRSQQLRDQCLLRYSRSCYSDLLVHVGFPPGASSSETRRLHCSLSWLPP